MSLIREDISKMKNLDIYKYHLDTIPRVADAITNGAADPIIVAKVIYWGGGGPNFEESFPAL